MADQTLIDQLVPVADDVRGELHGMAGDRPYEVYFVKRRASGGRQGEGSWTIVSDVLVTPTPLLSYPQDQTIDWTAVPGGRQETGNGVLSEVSLSYTRDQITGGTLAPNEQNYVRVIFTSGNTPTQYYEVAGEPWQDRQKTIGWVVQLRFQQGFDERGSTPAGGASATISATKVPG